MDAPTIAQRFVQAFGDNDLEALDRVYDDEVVLFSPIAWGMEGKEALFNFVAEFHRGYPGMRVALHDELYSADETRAAFRFMIHWHNTGEFFGHSPSGMEGTMTETHMIRIRDGRIVEQIVGDNTFQMPYLELVVRKVEVQWETPDPAPEIISAGGRR
jgi:ketosteroid isomerase-like protein